MAFCIYTWFMERYRCKFARDKVSVYLHSMHHFIILHRNCCTGKKSDVTHTMKWKNYAQFYPYVLTLISWTYRCGLGKALAPRDVIAHDVSFFESKSECWNILLSNVVNIDQSQISPHVPLIVHAPNKLSMLRWLPRQLIVLSSFNRSFSSSAHALFSAETSEKLLNVCKRNKNWLRLVIFQIT